MFTAKWNGTNENGPGYPWAAISRGLQTRQGFITAGDGVGVDAGATEFPFVFFGRVAGLGCGCGRLVLR